MSAGPGRWLLLAAACLAAGCGLAERKAERYRVEQTAYAAHKAEREVRLMRTRPDSTALLKLRAEYARVRAVSTPPYIRGASVRDRSVGRDVLRLVAGAELQSARLAIEAGRPDIALESSRWLADHAEGDTLVARQSDFLAVGALRMMGRQNEAIERMRGMLTRYPPNPPPAGSSEEDAILTVPEMMAGVRRDQGDEAGAKRELDNGAAYLRGLLSEPRDPMLEAQIRSRLVRILLEQNQAAAAIEQVSALDRLVAANPPLRELQPELEYSRAKIRAMTDHDPGEGTAMLEQFAARYPKHPLASRALLDAAVFLEDAKRLPDALARYREVVARYPGDEELAPIALFREAMLEERTGDWDRAKSTLESLPVKYPRSQAAVEAPFTIAMRYYARGDKDAAKVALGRAVAIYTDMIAKDSTS
ncbi:MAG TPA: tetratricopeptide repeat protein, partial [Candidatus Limnocylindrales bacterium]|nr:tetratricopeptide repeat protein [Candidatus Limnocylindrales bacterium]